MLYTVKEVSELLKVNRNHVYDLIKSNQLKAVKVGSIKVRKSDLENYIDSLDEIK